MATTDPIAVRTEALFLEQRRSDPMGHAVHAWLGALACALLCAPTSIMEFCAAPVGVCFLLRLPRHFRLDLQLFRQPVVHLVVLFAAWMAISLSWSPDVKQGLDELGKLRFVYLSLFLWPVIDRRPLLIAGLIAGFLSANAAQVVHAVGTHFHIPAITFPRMPHRDSGWWQPVVGGSMLTAAVGLHLGAALTGRGRVRAVAIVGVLISLVAVAATGSRGAWLASGALVAGAMIWALGRAGLKRVSWGHVPLIAALAVLGVVGAYQVLGDTITQRANAGIREVRDAIEHKDFTSDTGARLLMGWWAIEAMERHPVRGIGAGGYHVWVVQHLKEQGIDPATRSIHAHAHNAALHIGATMGIIGLALAGAVVVLSIRGGFTSRSETGGHGEEGESQKEGQTGFVATRLSGYAIGPAVALIGLVLVSLFDTIEVNAQTSALTMLLVALCMRGRARSIGWIEPCAGRIAAR